MHIPHAGGIHGYGLTKKIPHGIKNVGGLLHDLTTGAGFIDPPTVSSGQVTEEFTYGKSYTLTL
jgi:hypothetical protein